MTIEKPLPQTSPKPPIQPSIDGVKPTVTPVVTTVTNTSSPPTMSLPTPSTTSSGSTSHPINPNRGSTQTGHQVAVSEGAMFKANIPVTSQALVQLLDVLDEVTQELQCKESTEEASSVAEVHEIVKEFQESPQ